MTAKIAFVASRRPEAQTALRSMTTKYGQCDEADADVIVALGGDGCMLDTLRRRFDDPRPVYGMNQGTVGFLMNDYQESDLQKRLDRAERAVIYPLRMSVKTLDGETSTRLAINEVSLLRQSSQTARLQVTIDGRVRMSALSCDGVLVATPAGSTAYNLSAHGPILPIGANLLALTPISPFRPRRWRGALLRHDAVVKIDVTTPELRPVAASADNQEVRDAVSVTITEERSKPLVMLFDEGHALEERILQEQFAH
ncbi:MAG: NAD kinase [Ponticaulis sp.]|nr:NAD kinase [Ponticaulis sp.]|tara:strand:+ start:37897 stop:38661 length:765 start_codon:yes stop_codon:yes gene_type:complete